VATQDSWHAGQGTLAMYPKKSAIWPVHSFPETANKNQNYQITLLSFLKKSKKLSSLLAQPNLHWASLKTDYNIIIISL
jgi:hypothetical protein